MIYKIVQYLYSKYMTYNDNICALVSEWRHVHDVTIIFKINVIKRSHLHK